VSDIDPQDRLVTELPLGVPTQSRARTVTAGEIALLAGLSEWPTPVDTIDRLAAESQPLELEPHLVLAVLVSLATTSPLFHQLEQQHGLVIAAALSHRVSLIAPVRAADTIVSETVLEAIRASTSKPGQYVATIKDSCSNQDREQVAVITRVLLLKTQPALLAAKDLA
jgi:acyl dehydratase